MADDLTAGSPILGSPSLGIRKKFAALAVELRRKQFEAGEGWALFDAADLCARAGMAMPEWLANAFCERYLDWHLFRAKSLDTAFGVTRKKGMHVDERMHREWLRPRVVLQVLDLAKGAPIDPALFERVGEALEISGALARSVYYDAATDEWRRFIDAFMKFGN